MSEIAFDHHAADFAQTCTAQYDELRGTCPVAHSTTYGGFWVVARYEDVVRIGRDNETFSSAGRVVLPANEVDRLIPLECDPPDLQFYRRILTPFFAPPAVAALGPFVRATTDRAIDAFAGRGSVELVGELASPVPSSTTMEMLGLDPGDWRKFAEPLHDASYARPGSPANLEAQQRIHAFSADIVAAVDERIAAPRGDMISALLAGEHEGRRITRQEAIDMVRMVIFGGMDTVMAALGNVFVQFARRPELYARLRDDRALLPAAIDEFLRFDAPVQGFARTLAADAVVGDVALRAGETVFMLYASANRDADVFGPDADTLDITRFPNRHLTFGVGGHRCLGATLARAEMRIVLDRMFDRLPDLRIDPASVVAPETIGIVAGPLAVSATF